MAVTTAYRCLEDSHWDVAQAAMELAEAAGSVLGASSSALQLDNLEDALIRFREVAARPI